MCWSAEADLVAGAVVSGLGVWCLARVRRPRDLPLAALPLVLGAHQLIEAAVWSGAESRPPAEQWARVAWAVIALPLLAALVPLGVWLSAGPVARPPGPRASRSGPRIGRLPRSTGPAARSPAQRCRAALALLGTAVAIPLAVAVAAHPVTAEIHGRTLRYGVGIPYAPVLLACYLLATVGALLLSGDRLLQLLGLLVGVGALVCGLLWQLAFISTWCALAALAGVVLLRWTDS